MPFDEPNFILEAAPQGGRAFKDKSAITVRQSLTALCGGKAEDFKILVRYRRPILPCTQDPRPNTKDPRPKTNDLYHLEIESSPDFHSAGALC